MSASLVALLHVCDSLFPIGAFSHSDGLEGATAGGQVRSAADLEHWMRATLDQTLRRLEGPAARRAWRALACGHLELLDALDAEVHALRPSSTGREASRATGHRLIRTWEEIRPHPLVGVLVSNGARFTLPVAFGVVAAAAGVPERAALEGYAYTRLAAIVSAAMRLIPLGQHEAHRLLAAALDLVPPMVAEILDVEEPLRSFAPSMDIAAMSQQYVHSRLFRS
jgi:urease accessory protein